MSDDSRKLCIDPTKATIKRVAWAFGCAKKGSREESELYRALVEKLKESRHAG